MRASRLLSIQMLLQARGRMSARALADELQVSVRTLHRDVDQLSAAGVPIYAERGRTGGFALLDGWKTTLTGLTPAESQAVFLGGLAGPAAQLGLGEAVTSSQRKLLAALPGAWRQQAQTVSSRLHLDPIDWYREPEPVPHLNLLAEAVWTAKQAVIRYAGWQRTTTRTVGPLGLVLKAGSWYLVALQAAQPRTFRVSQVLSAELLDAPVDRPDPFDLARHWVDALKRFERGLFTGEATVLATPAGLQGLRQLGSAVAKAVDRAVDKAQAGAADTQRRDGRLQLRLPIESHTHAGGQLLGLAPDVEVLAPEALRTHVVDRLRQALRRYRPRR
jgi:predicted DNA-binding transcriptional regulator YafY